MAATAQRAASLTRSNCASSCLTSTNIRSCFSSLNGGLRNPKVIDILADVKLTLDSKQDYQDKAVMSDLADRLRKLGLTVKLLPDEMHSAWMVSFKESTEGERLINIELAAQPEYRRLRSLSSPNRSLKPAPFPRRRQEVGSDHR